MPTTATIPTVTYSRLRTLCEMFEDHQKNRISQQNRLRSLTTSEYTRSRRRSMDDVPPLVATLLHIENELSRDMIEEYHRVAPSGIIEWQEDTPGVGDHTLARLLGHLGHPRHAQPEYWADNPSVADGEFGDADNPKKALILGDPFERTVGQLWQYTGHGRAERRRKGMTKDEALRLGNPRCKMLVHLIATGVVKEQIRKNEDGTRTARGELGEFYLAEKLRYNDRTHSGPCSGGYTAAGPGKILFAKCKVEGRHAEAGDPYSPGHVNAIALRHLGKEILRELWEAS